MQIGIDGIRSKQERECQMKAATEASQRHGLLIVELLRKAKEPAHQNAQLRAQAMLTFVEGLAERHEALIARCEKRTGEAAVRIFPSPSNPSLVSLHPYSRLIDMQPSPGLPYKR